MAEYIEREAAIRALVHFKSGFRHGEERCAIDGCVLEIKTARAADVAPVVHGRWVWHLGEWVSCSECHTIGSPQWKGCPVCLARMDGE